jgi:hypothetical protein
MIGPIIGGMGAGMDTMRLATIHLAQSQVIAAGGDQTALPPEPETLVIKEVFPITLCNKEEMPPLPKNKNRVPFYRGIHKRRRK